MAAALPVPRRWLECWNPSALCQCGGPRTGVNKGYAVILTATVLSADINVKTKVVVDDLLARTRSIMGAGEGMDPHKVLPFFARGCKMILCHGAGDPSIPAVRTVMYYEQLAAVMKGMPAAQNSAQLFLVPGMHHCSGRPGPDQFDTLSALEAWVEQGQTPMSIPARTRPDAVVQRQIPLCPYPQQARYSGNGVIGPGANWRCEVPSGIAKGSRGGALNPTAQR